MNDELRDAVRSAIAEIVAESPEPPSYHRIVAPEVRPAVRWSGPVWALAAFVVVLVVIGAAAWLRPTTAPVRPVADVPSISADVATAALPSVFVTASHIPDGLSLVRAERGLWDAYTFLTFSGRTGANATEKELLVAVSTPRAPDFPPDIGVIAGRLAAAFPDATVTETTVRGQPAFLIDTGESQIHGWTTAVVTIEESGLISEVQGRFIDASEVLAVARGLVSVSRDEFEQTAVDATAWDLQVDAYPADPTHFLSLVADVPGVESTVLSTLHLYGPAVARAVERDSSQAIPTTTEPVATASGSATTAPTIGEPIRVMVTLKPGVDPETIAAAIHDLGDFAQISYSPAIAATISKEYLETVLSSAAIIHQDPIIYQPQPGPEPRFDTSTLGTEVTLEAATTATGFPDSTLRDIYDLGRRVGPTPVPLEGPIINIGSIDNGRRLVLAFVNDRDFLEVTVNRSGGAGAGGDILGAVYRYGVTTGGGGSGGWHINVRVPLETSVVSVAFDDGTALWQRSIGGYGLFPVASDISRLSGTITALAADGTVIDQWDMNP